MRVQRFNDSSRRLPTQETPFPPPGAQSAAPSLPSALPSAASVPEAPPHALAATTSISTLNVGWANADTTIKVDAGSRAPPPR